jgi:hypothetical protein
VRCWSVTLPEAVETGRIPVTAWGRRSWTATWAATAAVTGAPRFSRMTVSFRSNDGGAGGGATRATTERDTTAAGGRITATPRAEAI